MSVVAPDWVVVVPPVVVVLLFVLLLFVFVVVEVENPALVFAEESAAC